MSMFLHQHNDFFFPTAAAAVRRPRRPMSSQPLSALLFKDIPFMMRGFIDPFDDPFLITNEPLRGVFGGLGSYGVKRPNTVVAVLPIENCQSPKKSKSNSYVTQVTSTYGNTEITPTVTGDIATAKQNHATSASLWSPVVDSGLKDLGSHIQVELEIPNLKSSDLKITVVNQTMTIEAQAETKVEEKIDGGHFVRRSTINIKRTWTLPDEIDAKHLVVSYDKAVVQVNAPKKLSIAATAQTLTTTTLSNTSVIDHEATANNTETEVIAEVNNAGISNSPAIDTDASNQSTESTLQGEIVNTLDMTA